MDQMLASLMFFTRLPWWRLRQVPKEAFEHVVDWWPLTGWLTGGVMALTFMAAALLGCSPALSALMAIAMRLLLTGGLHEDGLADFCDGFGGGQTRERTMAIMKDSHIGTYGVLGLMVCTGLLWAAITSIASAPAGLPEPVAMPAGSAAQTAGAVMASGAAHGGVQAYVPTACILLFCDVAAKCAASFITGQLPYARTAQTAKNQVVYVGRSLHEWLAHALRCVVALTLPVGLLTWQGLSTAVLLLPVPFATELLLMLWMRRRLGGYTGDCCGALFILCELSLYLALQAL